MTFPNNEDRSVWAEHSLEVFAQETGLDTATEMETAVSDLLCNIMHLCNRREDLDFDHLLERARNNFREEVFEDEAASHSPG